MLAAIRQFNAAPFAAILWRRAIILGQLLALVVGIVSLSSFAIAMLMLQGGVGMLLDCLLAFSVAVLLLAFRDYRRNGN